jgi:secreted trypsin-like serine protease
MSEREHARMRIINGTIVHNASATYSFFALPTADADSDSWLGCGASIISPTYGLTSAHCFGGGLTPCSGPRTLALWLGEVELQADRSIAPVPGSRSFRVVAEVQCSKDFDGKCSHGHDLALLRLKSPLPDWVTPVPIAMGSDNLVGSSVTTIGFGMTESPDDAAVIGDVSTNLRQVPVDVLADDSEQCARVYSGGWGCSDKYSEGNAINLDQQLCAGAADFNHPRDTCAGDSGSPMVDQRGVQVGIVSYGGGPGEKMSGPGRQCGDPNYPGVYARVSAFADFIKAHVTDLPGSGGVDAMSDGAFQLQQNPNPNLRSSAMFLDK